jgi:hypothetical protein
LAANLKGHGMNNRTRTIVILASVAGLFGIGAACVRTDTSGGILGFGTNAGAVKYFQILDGAFKTVFFENQPFPDGPTYVFDDDALAAVFDFFPDSGLTLDFVTKTPGSIEVDGMDAPVIPGSSRVIRGGVALGFGASIAGNVLTDATQDFLAGVDVGDTVEIESGSGVFPGLYTVLNVAATQLTLDRSAGDSGGSMNVIYHVRNNGDSVIVRFNLDVLNPDGSVRSIEVGMMLDFSYDGQSLVGLFNSISITTLGGSVTETLVSGTAADPNVNILLSKTANESGGSSNPTSQPTSQPAN